MCYQFHAGQGVGSSRVLTSQKKSGSVATLWPKYEFSWRRPIGSCCSLPKTGFEQHKITSNSTQKNTLTSKLDHSKALFYAYQMSPTSFLTLYKSKIRNTHPHLLVKPDFRLGGNSRLRHSLLFGGAFRNQRRQASVKTNDTASASRLLIVLWSTKLL